MTVRHSEKCAERINSAAPDLISAVLSIESGIPTERDREILPAGVCVLQGWWVTSEAYTHYWCNFLQKCEQTSTCSLKECPQRGWDFPRLRLGNVTSHETKTIRCFHISLSFKSPHFQCLGHCLSHLSDYLCSADWPCSAVWGWLRWGRCALRGRYGGLATSDARTSQARGIVTRKKLHTRAVTH